MKEMLERLTARKHLTAAEAQSVVRSLTDESVSPAVAGAVLAALATKGETPDEVRGFAAGMRELAVRPTLQDDDRMAVDIVGTGGDGAHSLNLSTGAALLTAACGVPVIKHGNRSISSRCGSADVLEALGIRPPTPERVGTLLATTGFTFLFAPYFHPAMKRLAPIRKALGVRTVFNILGPLTNPAMPPCYVIGAYSHSVAQLMAEALAGLPIERAFVVHGPHGWDEPTPAGPFTLWDVQPGRVRVEERTPSAYGLPLCRPEDLLGGSASENATRLREAFSHDRGPHRHALALGAALALEVTGVETNPARAAERALAGIDDGRANQLLDQLVSASGAEAVGHG
jgi:anthranilate phosphoribosyltransferase